MWFIWRGIESSTFRLSLMCSRTCIALPYPFSVLAFLLMYSLAFLLYDSSRQRILRYRRCSTKRMNATHTLMTQHHHREHWTMILCILWVSAVSFVQQRIESGRSVRDKYAHISTAAAAAAAARTNVVVGRMCRAIVSFTIPFRWLVRWFMVRRAGCVRCAIACV